MFFSFSPTEILYISSRVLLYVFKFNFSFCVNNGLEKKKDAFIKGLFSCLTNATKEFKNIVLLGDFNMTAENTKM